MLSIIAAIANNNVIGKNNNLIWHIPEDLKRFKKITSNKTIIMGRKTFESLGRVLPNRKHIIISQNNNLHIDNENIKIITDIKNLDSYIDSDEEHFVIGGQSIYTLLFPYVTKMYITKINADFDGDSFFPEINEAEWKITEQEQGLRDDNNPYNYKYITYIRLDDKEPA